MKISFGLLGLTDLKNVILYESSATRFFVEKLEQYKDLYFPEPKLNWDIDEYKKRVYERTVIEELEFLLRINPDLDIIDAAIEFMGDLEPAYNDFDTPDEVFEILSVFIETLQDIVDWVKYEW